ncbi:MAG TPA: DNA-formamidopyrimidine glycosylase family protein [Actinomycetota bacterium]|nr:DNA-formamidopyrimidine glycosylase family protein [Actinomycetota bacterium]
MPELPDVEGFRRFWAEHAEGRTVRRVVTTDPAIVRNATTTALDRALRGRTFAPAVRHGKWLISGTEDGPAILFHFGMTGWFLWGDSPTEPEPRHRHDRVIVELAEGEVRYRNMRKLGGVWLAHDDAEANAITGGLGPDALSVDRRRFRELLAPRRGGVKAVLMDQTFVAGIGNLLADEILWQARVHPKRRLETMSPEDRDRLFDAMRKVVRESVGAHGDYIEQKRTWLLHVRGAPGAVCPRCHTPLERTTAAGRTTWFCPSCQALPVEAAA